ncbi:hypothetical protein BDK51DRAFT_38586 [Blyttiomyces helicus]|uniref:Uncharacterized protein n=1 Tax=Blyttiomyces helicus TaxID=388810 RepID=A0A4P9VWK7_9FUNG|nr:hypothetical protein BDK51DRAFT_38586 [Blyttiomyces helicus]|eukprot:RKO84091.1 hypothetical protein BDK51DRAFT_38586 [Blyttiomyces helicus]
MKLSLAILVLAFIAVGVGLSLVQRFKTAVMDLKADDIPVEDSPSAFGWSECRIRISFRAGRLRAFEWARLVMLLPRARQSAGYGGGTLLHRTKTSSQKKMKLSLAILVLAFIAVGECTVIPRRFFKILIPTPSPGVPIRSRS